MTSSSSKDSINPEASESRARPADGGGQVVGVWRPPTERERRQKALTNGNGRSLGEEGQEAWDPFWRVNREKC